MGVGRVAIPTAQWAWCAARSMSSPPTWPTTCAVSRAPIGPVRPNSDSLSRWSGEMTTRQLSIDPVACDAYGYCAELLPEAITLDEWGYPMVNGRTLPPERVARAQRAGR